MNIKINPQSNQALDNIHNSQLLQEQYSNNIIDSLQNIEGANNIDPNLTSSFTNMLNNSIDNTQINNLTVQESLNKKTFSPSDTLKIQENMANFGLNLSLFSRFTSLFIKFVETLTTKMQ